MMVNGKPVHVKIKSRTGDTGPQGDTGPAGQKGRDGQDGKDGRHGDTGRKGDTGPRGDTGPSGQKGGDGKDGLQGLSGKDGVSGTTGPAGKDGRHGATGRQGDTGPRGDAGKLGDTGPKGDSGPRGDSGGKGDTGPSGRDGRDGLSGPQGIPGRDGRDGVPGPPGPAGRDGKDGEAGPSILETRTLYVDGQSRMQGVRESFACRFNNIGAAISAARDGDIVYVCPGEYQERKFITQKSLNFVFSAGSVVKAISGPLFSATGSQRITILGHGEFHGCGNTILETPAGFSGVTLLKAMRLVGSVRQLPECVPQQTSLPPVPSTQFSGSGKSASLGYSNIGLPETAITAMPPNFNDYLISVQGSGSVHLNIDTVTSGEQPYLFVSGQVIVTQNSHAISAAVSEAIYISGGSTSLRFHNYESTAGDAVKIISGKLCVNGTRISAKDIGIHATPNNTFNLSVKLLELESEKVGYQAETFGMSDSHSRVEIGSLRCGTGAKIHGHAKTQLHLGTVEFSDCALLLGAEAKSTGDVIFRAGSLTGVGPGAVAFSLGNSFNVEADIQVDKVSGVQKVFSYDTLSPETFSAKILASIRQAEYAVNFFHSKTGNGELLLQMDVDCEILYGAGEAFHMESESEKNRSRLTFRSQRSRVAGVGKISGFNGNVEISMKNCNSYGAHYKSALMIEKSPGVTISGSYVTQSMTMIHSDSDFTYGKLSIESSNVAIEGVGKGALTLRKNGKLRSQQPSTGV